jgi:hypothetical protein
VEKPVAVEASGDLLRCDIFLQVYAEVLRLALLMHEGP